MRDLIRNYKNTISGKIPNDSGSETDPLVSSCNSTSTCTSQDDCMFNDTEFSDYETEKPKIGTSVSLPFSYQNGRGKPEKFIGNYRSISIDGFHKEETDVGRYQFISNLGNAFSASCTSLLSKSLEYQEMGGTKSIKTQSSLVTIFAIWNTTMGSSLLAMAWGMEKAGLIPGIIINILVAGFCLYTCYVLLKINENHGVIGQNNEVSELCRMLIGKWAEVIAKVFSLVVLIGANIVYWVLMSNFLYNSVQLFYDYLFPSSVTLDSNDTLLCPSASVWNVSNTNSNYVLQPDVPKTGFARFWDLYSTVPVILGIIMFPLLNFKSPTFFTKFNSLGTTSVMYLLIFAAVKATSWGINIPGWQSLFNLKTTFCALSGMLSLSYFIHNIIISVMRSNSNQENNVRDLSIAFGLVTFTYLFLGIAFYITFPLAKSCIQDNILDNFNKRDTLTIIARLLLLFQLVTVFPLISFMLRNDIFTNVDLFFKNYSPGHFSYVKVVILNLGIIAVCILFACFLPKIGTLIRYTGALSGMVYIFLLPSLLKIASLRKEGQLTVFKLVFQLCIIGLGVLNLISQFFIAD
ncbi:sodium-coupled neutral amino acid transporter 9 homolog [Agrilus planipennis]|uniref:Sodium-coupled neutral amino acid transporter 9 homolog n=1 Tax=Agrilus planipennis TaxID=224129 RepID=A0A1W4WSP1_AGRPL|nr:sodium-coupled neutral amino acid transporter 9 homolog [Agrilus planipennis]